MNTLDRHIVICAMIIIGLSLILEKETPKLFAGLGPIIPRHYSTDTITQANHIWSNDRSIDSYQSCQQKQDYSNTR